MRSCYGCTIRHYNCHSGCKEHHDEKQAKEAEKEQIRKAKARDNDIYACTILNAVEAKMHYAVMRRAMY